MKYKYLFTWILLLVSVVGSVYGQENFQLGGRVVDDTDQPVPGVTVYLRDKIGVGTTTDNDGKFAIKVSRGDMVIFKYIGFKDV